MRSWIVLTLAAGLACNATDDEPPGSGETSGSSGSTSTSTSTSTSDPTGSTGSSTTSPQTSEGSSTTEQLPVPPPEECIAETDRESCEAIGCVFREADRKAGFILYRAVDDQCEQVQNGICLSIPGGAIEGFNDVPVEYGLPGLELGFLSLDIEPAPNGFVRCDSADPPRVCEVCFGSGGGTTGNATDSATDGETESSTGDEATGTSTTG